MKSLFSVQSRVKGILLFYGILSCNLSWAESSQKDRIQQLKIMTDQGQSEEAYQLASPWVTELEGQPLFDFYYGIAAVDSGHAGEGVMALERVLLVHPDNDRVRLEYARGMYMLEDNDTAKAEFTRVLDSNPPKSVAIKIRRYLDLIAKREELYKTTYLAYVQGTVGYDSNLNSAPEDQLNRVELTEGSLGKGDSYVSFNAGVGVTVPLDKQNSLFSKANIDNKQYQDEKGFDNQSINVLGGWRHKLDKNDRLQLIANGQNYRVDGDSFRNMFGLTGDWTHNVSNTLTVGGYLSVSRLVHPDSALEWRDSIQFSGGGNLYTTLPIWHSPILFSRVFYGDETPDDSTLVSRASVEKRFYGGSLGLQLPITDNNTATLSGLYQNARYAGDDWLYGVRRDDDYKAINFSWGYRHNKNITVNFNASLIENDSSIELYQFDRENLSFSLKYEY